MNALKSIITKQIVNTPQSLLIVFKRLPQSLQKTWLTTVLNQVFAETLQQGDLAFLQEKWLAVEITDTNYQLFITNSQDRLEIKLEEPTHIDVTFKAETQTLLKLMSRTVDPDTLFFKRQLLVTGDTELGLEIKNLLDEMPMESLPAVAQKGLQAYVKLLT